MDTNLKLPRLSYQGFEKNKQTLHLLLQIIGKIRMAKSPRKNHWWNVTLYVNSNGLTTGPIPFREGLEKFTITLNLLNHRLEIKTSTGEDVGFPLREKVSIAQYYEHLSELLQQMEIEASILDKPFDLGIDQRFSELTEYHHYNEEYTEKLWKVLLWVDDVFKEFSGRFYGKTCPVHLYWHSMDLAVTRFSGRKAPPMASEARLSDKDAYTHEVISFGFWPGDKNLPEPAFYSYTYPSPEGLANQALQPSEADWVVNNGSPMAVLTYSSLLQIPDSRTGLLNFMESAYQAGAGLAGWDIKEFEVPPLSAL